MQDIKVGDRVKALYPNAKWGEAVVTEVCDVRGQKPLVTRRDDGTTGYFHLDQVEVVS